MDFFQEAQKFTQAAKGLVQEGKQQLTEATEEAKSAAMTLSTSSTTALAQLKAATSELVQQTSATLDQTNQSVRAGALELTASGEAKVEALRQQVTQVAQQGLENVSAITDGAQGTILAIGVSGGAIAASLQDLPRTAEELARVMPKLAYRLQHRAGLRLGDAPRSDADVLKLFEKIPGTTKLGVDEIKIRQFLADKHGSHIIARHRGGSNGADNILWEVGTDNLRRGARTMTGGEQVYIRFYNAVDSIVKNSGTITKLGLTATGTAILTQSVVTAVANALDLYRGDITMEEFRDRVIRAAVSAGIATPLFFLVLVAVLALFPELALLLSAPVVVAGFNALFGIGIAVPIIQSLVRHLEAGGFGTAMTEGYQQLLGRAQPLLEVTASEI